MTADFAPEKNVSKPQDRGATYLKNSGFKFPQCH